VHWNYAATTQQRKEKEAGDNIRAMSAGSWGKQGGGSYGFEHGHMLLWTQWANPEDRPNFAKKDEYTERYGEAMAKWMIERSRNLCIYPNVYFMDQFGSQIRVCVRSLSIRLK
jgi:Ring hydroxylating alpha subunit (catalytic domain).